MSAGWIVFAAQGPAQLNEITAVDFFSLTPAAPFLALLLSMNLAPRGARIVMLPEQPPAPVVQLIALWKLNSSRVLSAPNTWNAFKYPDSDRQLHGGATVSTSAPHVLLPAATPFLPE